MISGVLTAVTVKESTYTYGIQVIIAHSGVIPEKYMLCWCELLWQNICEILLASHNTVVVETSPS